MPRKNEDIESVLRHELKLTELAIKEAETNTSRELSDKVVTTARDQLALHNTIRVQELKRKRKMTVTRFTIAVAFFFLFVFLAGFAYMIYTVEIGTFDIVSQGYKAFLIAWLGSTAFGILLTLSISSVANIFLSVGAEQLIRTVEKAGEAPERTQKVVQAFKDKKLVRAQNKAIKAQAEVAKINVLSAQIK